jgi:hypothetical protein
VDRNRHTAPIRQKWPIKGEKYYDFHEDPAVAKFAAVVVDTGGKLWCTFTCEYLHEFSKKFEMTLMLFSGAWRKMIHEKT